MTAHRIRLRVNAHQARTLARWCEAARLAWNWALEEGDRQLRDRRGGRGFVRRRGRWIPVGLDWAPNPDAPLEDLSRLLTRVRRVARLWWMVEPPARVYRTEIRTLAEAWSRMRQGLARRPVPKRFSTSFALSNQDVVVEGRRIRIPKLGWLRLEERLRWRGRVKTARISVEAGAWYVSLGMEWDHVRGPAPDVSAGVDASLKTLAVVASADGAVVQRVANPRAHDAWLRRLRRTGRGVSRKLRGSANWRRAVVRLARLHVYAAAVRRDAGEQGSTAVARLVRRVGVEDLSVTGMLRSRRMARRVADAAMSWFIARLGVKVLEAGGEVLRAPRTHASTRTCSACGARTERIPPGLAGLAVRRWSCERCGADHDRDINAAKNLDPAVWSGPHDAASQAESENARGQACQSPASAGGGGLDEAGSAIARNPHAGASSSRRSGVLADQPRSRDPAVGSGRSGVATPSAPG